MTEQATRRKTKYTDEFRADAVRLVLDEALPVAQVARDSDMPTNTLHSWVKRARASEAGSTEGGKVSKDEREELKRLRRENRTRSECHVGVQCHVGVPGSPTEHVSCGCAASRGVVLWEDAAGDRLDVGRRRSVYSDGRDDPSNGAASALH